MAVDIEQQMAAKRVEEFERELSALQEKYGVVILPILQQSINAISAQLQIFDKKMLEAATQSSTTPNPQTKN